jgi:TonB family protein
MATNSRAPYLFYTLSAVGHGLLGVLFVVATSFFSQHALFIRPPTFTLVQSIALPAEPPGATAAKPPPAPARAKPLENPVPAPIQAEPQPSLSELSPEPVSEVQSGTTEPTTQATTSQAGSGSSAAVDTVSGDAAGLVLVPKNTPKPEYPSQALSEGIEGDLIATILIDRMGFVTSVRIVNSPHPSISAVATRVLRTWRYAPPLLAGHGVMVEKRLVISYTLTEE